MLALVRPQVDAATASVEQHRDAGAHRGGIAGQREDRAVVGRIRLHVEDAQAGSTARKAVAMPRRRPAGVPSLILGTHSMMGMCTLLPHTRVTVRDL